MTDTAKSAIEPAGIGRRLRVDVTEDPDAGYVARVHGFDLYTQGPTEREALDNAREASRLFVESCRERGVIPQVLASL